MLRVHNPSTTRMRWTWAAALVAALLLLAACAQPGAAPAEQPAAAEAPAEEAMEPTEAPAEEAAEPAEAPAEEAAEPTAAAEDEAEPTAAAEEEEEGAEATPMAEEEEAEATPTAEEEGAEATPMAEEGAEASAGDPVAGEYLVNTARGCGCHFNGDLGGRAGGNEFEGPFGEVYSANITPHPETGIGGLTDQQVADAIRFGKRADGANLFIMPKFSFLSDKDVMDIVAYLRTQEPIDNAVPPRNLNFEPPAFEVTTPPPAEAPTEPVARGEYLVALARCTQCHTPTNEDGSPQEGMFLAGAPFRDDTVAPNLTPDEATGLGAWTEQEIVDFLATGMYSDGSDPHDAMKQVIEQATSKLTPEDRAAIAAYLKSLPPVENLPATPQ